MRIFQQRQRIVVNGGIRAVEGRTAKQHLDPGIVDKAGHRPPGHAQDIKIMPVGMQAEAAHFHHRAVKAGKIGQIVILRRITARDFCTVFEGKQAKAADERAGFGILDKDMVAARIKRVGIARWL